MKAKRVLYVVALGGVLAIAALQCGGASPATGASDAAGDGGGPDATVMDMDADGAADGTFPDDQDGGRREAAPVDVADAEGGPPCPASRGIDLDTINATAYVSPTGVEYYTFQVLAGDSQPAQILVRIRTAGPRPLVSVLPSCSASDGGRADSGGSLLTSNTAYGGVYARGALRPGEYDLRIDWTGASLGTGAAYGFEVMGVGVASNASCASPAQVASGGEITGTTFKATDTQTGCPPAPAYGRLFYSVQVPAHSVLQLTATPVPLIDAPSAAWTAVLEALPTCSSTTCASSMVSSSALAGLPATLSLPNQSSSPLSLVVALSSDAADAVTGGGPFALSASTLLPCPTDPDAASACNGTCCNGICYPSDSGNKYLACPSTCTNLVTDSSNCGACGTKCTVANTVCINSTCQCTGGLSLCSGACTDTSTDTNNCGTCGTQCTTTVANATASCIGRVCVPHCNDPTMTVCNGSCVNTASDDSNCGGCGTAYACTGGKHCVSSTCQCTGGTHWCGSQCVANDVNACGSNCTVCPPPAANGVATCDGTSCGITCATGFTNCSGSCSNLAESGNCGVCGTTCLAPNATTTASCATGACVVSCQTGYCGTPPSNCALANNTTHCGACGWCCPTWQDALLNYCDPTTKICYEDDAGTAPHPAPQDSRCPP